MYVFQSINDARNSCDIVVLLPKYIFFVLTAFCAARTDRIFVRPILTVCLCGP